MAEEKKKSNPLSSIGGGLGSAVGGVKKFLGGSPEDEDEGGVRGILGKPLVRIVIFAVAIVVAIVLIFVMLAQIGTGTPGTKRVASISSGTLSAAGAESAPQNRETPVDNKPGYADSFATTPILPDERDFILGGELGYERPPRKAWSMDDVRRLWMNLDDVFASVLRDVNHQEFLKLLENK